MRKIERALISTSNKEGIVEFARGLRELGIEILSTGGTARTLREAGVEVTSVSSYTGFPEILDGRVKTLHPKIAGGLLAVRDNPIHQKELAAQGIPLIGLVVVNLYPFEQTIAEEGTSLEDAIENIDIGGPTLIRASSKNYQDVVVVVKPSRYSTVLEQLRRNQGTVDAALRLELAVEAFATTWRYDGAIATYLDNLLKKREVTYAEQLVLTYYKMRDLRYGENPHQSATLYKEGVLSEPCAVGAELLGGKDLSFNNVLDLDAAIELVKEFAHGVCVIIKHTNPCGVALGESPLQCYRNARATDPDSAFGGIVGFNRRINSAAADELNKTFLEAIVAPGYDRDALETLQRKTQRRLVLLEGLETWNLVGGTRMLDRDLRKIVGGLLVQDRDLFDVEPQALSCVTKRRPTDEEMKALLFAWKVVKHVKSNAVVFATAVETVGIGAGQMSRVDATRLAIQKAKKPLKGTVVASDAFFPFRDGVDEAIRAGATAIIQPGGSVRDEESIAACDERDVAMIFTGVRHFRH